VALDQASERANQRIFEDVRELKANNATIEATNKHALAALKGVTGKDFGFDQVAWMAWWTDKKGYAFQAPPDGQTATKPTITEVVEPYRTHHSCFAAGTMVQTVDGPRPIEEIQVGDRLLTQDTTTGVLTYQPALTVFHNPPAATIRLKIGGEDVVATGIHRYWKAGQGWVMARELKVGDPIRQLGGIEVAKGADFLVGKLGILVHDNSLVDPVAKPFDAAPNLK
jgi:hypothetical protein